MQLKGISPLLTPEVLAGLAHLQHGQLVAVVGEGFPRLPRRLWGQSPWPMYFPQEVIVDDVGVRGILEGLLQHVPVDAFYWSTDHDREVPGYLGQVRWQVRSSSGPGRGEGVPDHGVPSDQLLEMVRTSELLVRTCEVRCNSPIVLRVGTVPTSASGTRESRRARRTRTKKVVRVDSPPDSSSAAEEEEKGVSLTVNGDGAPEAGVGKRVPVVAEMTDDKKADVGVQTTPRLARRAKLSLADVPPTADFLSSENSAESSDPSPLHREPLVTQGEDDSTVTHADTSGLQHSVTHTLSPETHEPAAGSETRDVSTGDGGSPPSETTRTPAETEAEDTGAVPAGSTDDVCQIEFSRRPERTGPRLGRAVFARRTPPSAPELPSSPPPPAPPTSPFWLGDGEELLQLQSVAIVRAAARHLRGEGLGDRSPPPDTPPTPLRRDTPDTRDAPPQEGERSSPPDTPLHSNPFQKTERSPSADRESPSPSLAGEAPLPPVLDIPQDRRRRHEPPLQLEEGSDTRREREDATPRPADSPAQDSSSSSSGSSSPPALTASTPRPRLRHRPLVSALKKPHAPAAAARKRVSFDENLVRELAAAAAAPPEQEPDQVDGDGHEAAREHTQPLVRVTCWGDEPRHDQRAHHVHVVDPPGHADAADASPRGDQRDRQADAGAEAGANAGADVGADAGADATQRLRKPWVRHSKPGLRLAVSDIIPVNTITLLGPGPRSRTRKLSDSFKTPYRSVPLCLPSPACDM